MFSSELYSCLLRGDHTAAMKVIHKHIEQREVLDQVPDHRLSSQIITLSEKVETLQGQVNALSAQIAELVSQKSTEKEETAVVEDGAEEDQPKLI